MHIESVQLRGFERVYFERYFSSELIAGENVGSPFVDVVVGGVV